MKKDEKSREKAKREYSIYLASILPDVYRLVKADKLPKETAQEERLKFLREQGIGNMRWLYNAIFSVNNMETRHKFAEFLECLKTLTKTFHKAGYTEEDYDKYLNDVCNALEKYKSENVLSDTFLGGVTLTQTAQIFVEYEALRLSEEL